MNFHFMPLQETVDYGQSLTIKTLWALKNKQLPMLYAVHETWPFHCPVGGWPIASIVIPRLSCELLLVQSDATRCHCHSTDFWVNLWSFAKQKMHLQIWEEGRLLDTERFLCLNFTHVVTTCRILSRWTQRTKEIDKSVYLCSPSKEVASSCATRTGRKKKRKKDKYRYYWYCHSSTLNHLW